MGRWFSNRKTIKEGLRVIWKTSRAYTQYPKEINSEVREFNLNGRVVGQRFAEAEGGGSQQVTEVRDRWT